MSRAICAAPVPLPVLVDYWLGDLDAAREDEVERHLFGCGDCCATLERFVDLAGGVRALVRKGAIAAVVTPRFVQTLARTGLRLREYRVPPHGSVHCTVAPDDDVLVSRLQAPLAGVQRLDLVAREPEGTGPLRLRDIPYSAAAGEVVIVPRIDRIRALHESTSTLQLIAVDDGHERVIGEYRFVHTPWPGS
jgi:hypothetical protein